MLIESLKNRKFNLKGQEKIVSLDGKFKHQVFNLPEMELILVKTPWDKNILINQEQESKQLSRKTLHLNLYLEAYQPIDTPFSDILNVAVVDEEPYDRS